MIKIVENAVTFIIALSPLFPLVVALVRYYGTKTRNQRIVNLAQRANVIVMSLEKLDLVNEEKREIGINKLCNYATEVGISLTPSQAHDYINGAVEEIRKQEEALRIG